MSDTVPAAGSIMMTNVGIIKTVILDSQVFQHNCVKQGLTLSHKAR